MNKNTEQLAEPADPLDVVDALLLYYGPDWPLLRRSGRLTDAMVAEAVANVTPEQLAAHRSRVASAVENMLERAM